MPMTVSIVLATISHTLQQGFGKTRVLNCITCIIMPWHHPYFKPSAMQNNVSVVHLKYMLEAEDLVCMVQDNTIELFVYLV